MDGRDRRRCSRAERNSVFSIRCEAVTLLARAYLAGSSRNFGSIGEEGLLEPLVNDARVLVVIVGENDGSDEAHEENGGNDSAYEP